MSDCILWQGPTNRGGYGLDGRTLAHRVAWETEHGPIPSGLVIHHDCGEPRCVNVEHLRCITHLEHNRIHRSAEPWWERQRSKTHCKHGHEYTTENTGRDRHGKRYCKACSRIQSAAYHLRNRERILPQMRERERRRRAERKAQA